MLTRYLPFYKRNLKVALPIMATQAGQVIVQLADNIMVGHVGTAQLAGVSFANSLFMLGLVFANGFTQGTTPHVGQAYGQGKFRKAGQLFQNSMILNTLMSVIVTLIMCGLGYAMNFMGQEPEVLKYAHQYYNIMLVSMIPGLIFFSIRQFSEGIGITKYAMYITLLANVLNIVLNWILIYGKLGCPAMGVQGAALATLISRVVMMVLFIILIFRIYPYKHYLKYFSRASIVRSDFVALLKTAMPQSLQALAEMMAFSMAAVMVGWLGATNLASHQIAYSLSSLTFMVALGIGSAATIRVSHLYGAGLYKEAKIAGIASIHLSVMLLSIAGLVIIVFRKYIPFLYSSDPAVIELTSKILIFVCVYQIFDAIQLASLASLRGLKDVTAPMVFSLISYFGVCIPLGYVCAFPLGLGVFGIWIGLALGLFSASILYYVRFIKLTNKIIKSHE